MRTEYRLAGIVLVSVVVGLVVLYASPMTKRNTFTNGVSNSMQRAGDRYHEIEKPAGFVNTDGITIGELVGKKVILVDFLTYSCINCQRTFPYVNAWYEAYRDQGLEIIGIHTPEFAFEKNIDNVRTAMKRFGITHPIVLDNDYATWRAFGNQYWPRKYLIDIHGNIVYDHIGEGGYEETEQKIREALGERARVLGEQQDIDGALAVTTVPREISETQSPETYFGALRNEFFANGKPRREGAMSLVVPNTIKRNALYLGGSWNVQDEYAETVDDSVVEYCYQAKRVYLVASSEEGGSIEVLLDGSVVGKNGGVDVGKDGMVSVKGSRLYELVAHEAMEEHVLTLRVRGKVRLFAFTFG